MLVAAVQYSDSLLTANITGIRCLHSQALLTVFVI